MKYQPCELSPADMERLSSILGGPPGNVSLVEESEFASNCGCPPDQFETWLEDCWLAYDAGEQIVGHDPVLLARQFDGYFTVRLYSPGAKLTRDSAEVLELQRIAEMDAVTDEMSRAEAVLADPKATVSMRMRAEEVLMLDNPDLDEVGPTKGEIDFSLPNDLTQGRAQNLSRTDRRVPCKHLQACR